MLKIDNGDHIAYNYIRSYSYVDRSLRNSSDEVSQNIKESWVPPFRCLVHWDCKTTNTLDGGDQKKQMVVSVSGVKEIKLLGMHYY